MGASESLEAERIRKISADRNVADSYRQMVDAQNNYDQTNRLSGYSDEAKRAYKQAQTEAIAKYTQAYAIAENLKAAPAAVNNMTKVMTDSKIDEEKVNVPASEPADQVVIKQIIALNDTAEQSDPQGIADLNTLAENQYNFDSALVNQVGSAEVQLAVNDNTASGRAYLTEVRSTNPDAARLSQLEQNLRSTQLRLTAALDNDVVLRTKVEASGGTNGWDTLKAVLKYGGILGAIYLFCKAVADDLSGCFMYHAETGQAGTSTKLSCPTKDHQNKCSCDQSHDACAAQNCAGDNQYYPYCCELDSVAWQKCCHDPDPNIPNDGYTRYTWKQVSPWDIPGLIIQEAAKIAEGIGAGLPDFFKYLIWILAAVGVILLVIFVAPPIINAFKKKE